MGFKENLRSELDYQDMIVKELAARAGVNKRTVDNYLSGDGSIPSADVAVRLARALGVTVEYLVDGSTTVSGPDFPPELRHIVQKLRTLDARSLRLVMVLVDAM